MAWIYLPESEESASRSSHGYERSAMSKSTGTAKPSSKAGSRPVTSKMRRSGTMLPPSIPMSGGTKLTSLQRDFLARISAKRDRARDWKESEAVYFSRSPGYAASSNLNSYFSKMYQESLLWVAQPSSVKLAPSGMTAGGAYYPLSMWERRTKGTDGGVWPTPNATDYKGPSTRSPGKERPECDDDLPARVSGLGGSLNPEFVEWLMNFPKGWTVVESHAIMGNKTTKEEHHGKTKKPRPGKVLRVLRETPQQENLRAGIGGYGGIQKEEILQQALHGERDGDSEPHQVGHSGAGQETPESVLRELRDYRNALHSPCGRELEEQCPFEFKDALQFLSHNLTSSAGRHRGKEDEAALLRLREALVSLGVVQYPSDTDEAAWESLSGDEKEWAVMAACFGGWWSEWPGVGRVASGVEKRVDRLKGLGNSVVSATAREAFRRLMGI